MNDKPPPSRRTSICVGFDKTERTSTVHDHTGDRAHTDAVDLALQQEAIRRHAASTGVMGHGGRRCSAERLHSTNVSSAVEDEREGVAWGRSGIRV